MSPSHHAPTQQAESTTVHAPASPIISASSVPVLTSRNNFNSTSDVQTLKRELESAQETIQNLQSSLDKLQKETSTVRIRIKLDIILTILATSLFTYATLSLSIFSSSSIAPSAQGRVQFTLFSTNDDSRALEPTTRTVPSQLYCWSRFDFIHFCLSLLLIMQPRQAQIKRTILESADIDPNDVVINQNCRAWNTITSPTWRKIYDDKSGALEHPHSTRSQRTVDLLATFSLDTCHP